MAFIDWNNNGEIDDDDIAVSSAMMDGGNDDDRHKSIKSNPGCGCLPTSIIVLFCAIALILVFILL